MRQAASSAELSDDSLRSAQVFMGLAGVTSDGLAQRVGQAIPFAHCVVADDRPAAVTGALGAQDGFVLSVGTGVIAARSRLGELRFVGGWGFQVADQGSAAWLGRRLLEEVLLAHDGVAQHSALTTDTLDQFGNDPVAIVEFAAASGAAEYGSLAPSVVAAAGRGDEVGLRLMREGARHLGRALTALDFQSGDALCLTGGVGAHYAGHLDARFTGNLVAAKSSAVTGALHLAARALRIREGTRS
jgi:glucosamine kinase